LLRVHAGCIDTLNDLIQFLLNLGLVSRPVFTKHLPDLGHKITFQELVDLVAPRVHDPVNAEVQIGLIKLKQLGEFSL